jgi:hypothetical protein
MSHKLTANIVTELVADRVLGWVGWGYKYGLARFSGAMPD